MLLLSAIGGKTPLEFGRKILLKTMTHFGYLVVLPVSMSRKTS